MQISHPNLDEDLHFFMVLYSNGNGELKSILEVEQAQNSQMFQIIATSPEPRKAALIANTTAKTFQEKAEEVLAVNKVTITSEAAVSSKSVFPNHPLNLLIGTTLGMVIGIGLAFLIEWLDKTVKDERCVIEALGMPVLGQVSEIHPKELMKMRKRRKKLSGARALNHLSESADESKKLNRRNEKNSWI